MHPTDNESQYLFQSNPDLRNILNHSAVDATKASTVKTDNKKTKLVDRSPLISQRKDSIDENRSQGPMRLEFLQEDQMRNLKPTDDLSDRELAAKAGQ